MENPKSIIFIVVGRLGKTLTLSKVKPIVSSGMFDKIFVFRQEKGSEIEGVTYITLEFLKVIKFKSIQKLIRYILEPSQLLFYTLKYNPDLINGYQLVPKGMYSFLVSRLTGKRCMVSSIGGISEIDTYMKPKLLWKGINLFILKHADIVTTKGDTVTNYLIKNGVSKEKIFTFNGAIDISKFFITTYTIKSIDLLFVGQLIELKGPDRFVLIVKELSLKYPLIKACIIGAGPLENLIKQMIEKYNLNNTIEIVGYVENVDDYFKRSKILIMPSRSEGLSTSMLEAMASGCVPVVSNVGCMNEAAINGVTAVLVNNYQDINEYVTLTNSLLINEREREKIANSAVKLIEDKYTIEKQGLIFKSIIEEKLN
jgi:glycosyltransferase involved in cell wall biosynthesis